MKKSSIILSFVFCLLSFGTSFAYTSTDVSNAEKLSVDGIIKKQHSTNDYRLDDKITRAEVMGIALKIQGVILPNYQCKGYYTDTRNNDWICRAVELAADNGIITKTNTKARPQDFITKAEALAIILKAQNGENSNNNIVNDVCSGMSPAFDQVSDIGTQEWQKRIIARSAQLGIIEYCSNFYANRNATRAEVFAFAGQKIVLTTPVAKITTQLYDKNGNMKTVVFQGDNIMDIQLQSSLEPVDIKAWYGHERDNSYIIVDPFSCDSRTNLVYGDEYRACADALKINQIQGGIVTSLGKVYVFGYGDGLDGKYFVTKDIRPQSNFYIAMKLLERYYFYLNPEKDTHYFRGEPAYDMRSPGVSFETFQSWYKSVTSVVFREDTLQDLGNNTYEFLVDMTENGVKSTYKVKSKVDLTNFKIDNISSVKQ